MATPKKMRNISLKSGHLLADWALFLGARLRPRRSSPQARFVLWFHGSCIEWTTYFYSLYIYKPFNKPRNIIYIAVYLCIYVNCTEWCILYMYMYIICHICNIHILTYLSLHAQSHAILPHHSWYNAPTVNGQKLGTKMVIPAVLGPSPD